MTPDGADRDGDADDSDVERGPVLSPEELDIQGDEHVFQIEDGRYVIRPDDDAPARSAAQSSLPADPLSNKGPTNDRDSPGADVVEMDRRPVSEQLEARVAGLDARFGFDITAKFEDDVHRRELFTNDVVTTFENLVTWYARHAGGDTPVEEVLGILLVEMNLHVSYPRSVLTRLLEAHDLDADDSVADLLAAVGDDGFRFPA